jgi:hypothetical protein
MNATVNILRQESQTPVADWFSLGPHRWCRDAYARDDQGISVWMDCPTLESLCLIGAIEVFYGRFPSDPRSRAAHAKVREVIRRKGHRDCLSTLNDSNPWEVIRDVCREAEI